MTDASGPEPGSESDASAAGSESDAASPEPEASASRSESDELGESVRRERTFRGISRRLAVHYLVNLGGRSTGEGRVEGDDWTAEVTHQRVGVGPTLKIDEVSLVVEGDSEAVDPLLERFAQKAMRAGG
jgi:hypothetical protein